MYIITDYLFDILTFLNTCFHHNPAGDNDLSDDLSVLIVPTVSH